MELTDSQKDLQRVVCAANKLPGEILLIGARHWDQHMVRQLKILKSAGYEFYVGSEEQGFIDQFDNFLTREEAWKIAKRQNQIIRICSDPIETENGMLFSENLY